MGTLSFNLEQASIHDDKTKSTIIISNQPETLATQISPMELEKDKTRGLRGRKLKNTRRKRGHNKETPCIHIQGSLQAKETIFTDYLPEHREMMSWDSQTGYSINKKHRWELQTNLNKVFNNNLDDLRREPFHVFAAVVHD